MRNIILIFVIILFNSLIVYGSENLIKNGNFEHKDTLKDYKSTGVWIKYQWKKQHASWQIIDKYCKVEAKSLESGAVGIRQWLNTSMLEKGKYILEFSCKGKSTGGLTVQILSIKKGRKDLKLLMSKFVLSNNGIDKRISFQVMGNTSESRNLIQFFINKSGNFDLSKVKLTRELLKKKIKTSASIRSLQKINKKNLAFGGAVYCSSELYKHGYPASGAVDGTISNWGKGGGWNDSTRDVFPDWLIIYLPYKDEMKVNKVVVHTLPGKKSALRNFSIQAKAGNDWKIVDSISDNINGRVEFNFPAISTRALRIYVQKAPEYSRILEVEAYGPVSVPVRKVCSATTIKLEATSHNAVFPINKAASFTLKLKNDSKLKDAGKIKWNIMTTTGKIIAGGSEPYSLLSGQSSRKTIKQKITTQGTYRLKIELIKNNLSLKYKQLLFGIRAEKSTIMDKFIPSVKDFSWVNKSPLKYRVNVGFNSNSPISRKYCEYLKSKGADGIIIVCHWSDLEPFEGVYNFTWMDESLNIAGELGLEVHCWFSYLDRYAPKWLGDVYMRDSFQRLEGADGGNGNLGVKSVSFFSERFKSSFFRTVKKVLQRYKQTPHLETWEFSLGRGEAYYPDVTKTKAIFGYSESAQKAFRDYQKKRYKTIREFNIRHSIPINSWEQINCPEPKWGETDLRAIWKDFIEFKMQAVYNFLNKLLPFAQSIDPDKRYAINGGGNGPLEKVYEIAEKYKAIASNCAWEGTVNELTGASVKNYNMSFRVEGGKLPPRQWNFGALMYNILKFGIKRYSWVGWMDDSNPAAESFSKYKKAFKVAASLTRMPAEVGVMFSYDTAMCDYYSLLWGSWLWFKHPLFKLLVFNHIPAEWFSDYSKFNKINKYKVIFDADSRVIKQKNLDYLTKYVKEGGWLVLGSESWTFCYNTGMKLDWIKKNIKDLQTPEFVKGVAARIFSYGKGKIILLNHPLVRLNKAELKKICAMTEVKKNIDASPRLRASLLHPKDMKTFYVPVFYSDHNYKYKPISTIIKISIPVDGIYEIHDIITGINYGQRSSRAISAGLTFKIKPNQLIMLQLKKVN